jgi:hypothetical protein
MSHPTNDTFAAASPHEANGPPPPEGAPNDALDHAGPTGYAPPQVRPLGTLPEATGMAMSVFELGQPPTRP